MIWFILKLAVKAVLCVLVLFLIMAGLLFCLGAGLHMACRRSRDVRFSSPRLPREGR